jgi:hypothetical protein
MPAGRPTEYSPEILNKVREYIDSCSDDMQVMGDDKKTVVLTVNLPTIEGLAYHLKLHKDTIYAWRKDEDKREFSDLIEELLAKQAKELVNKGLSGRYNPTIAKVLLTKHGYREGIDQTTNDKDLPVPILANALPIHDSNKESTESQA